MIKAVHFKPVGCSLRAHRLREILAEQEGAMDWDDEELDVGERCEECNSMLEVSNNDSMDCKNYDCPLFHKEEE